MAEVVADPETTPTATYAVDPARVRALVARVVASVAGLAGEGAALQRAVVAELGTGDERYQVIACLLGDQQTDLAQWNPATTNGVA